MSFRSCMCVLKEKKVPAKAFAKVAALKDSPVPLRGQLWCQESSIGALYAKTRCS